VPLVGLLDYGLGCFSIFIVGFSYFGLLNVIVAFLIGVEIPFPVRGV